MKKNIKKNMANFTSFLMGGHFNRHRSLIYEECYITTTILPVFDDEQWSLNCDCFRGARVSPDSSTNPRHLMCNMYYYYNPFPIPAVRW